MRNNVYDLVKTYKILPTKKLGQNFIIDTDIADIIAATASPAENFNILEIGPGLGMLTKSLLSISPKNLVVVEKDSNLAKLLNKFLGKNVKIINDDALKVDETTIIEKPIKIVANLPYNIGTKLLIKWLHNITYFEELIIMLQKEVADKIIAKPKTSGYGRLSVISQLLCDCEKIFDVAPESFYPKPKIFSSVLKLKTKHHVLSNIEIAKIEKISQLAFNQRRKTLKKSLSPLLSNPTEQLKSLDIDPKSRAEELSLEDFKKIF